LRDSQNPKNSFAARWLGQLVHESVADTPFELERHKSFIGARLMMGACILLAIPVWLFLYGSLDSVHLLVATFALAPLTAAGVLARTGRIDFAQKISLGGWLLFALASRAVADEHHSVQVMSLAVAMMEAALAADMIMVSAVAATAAGMILSDLLLVVVGVSPGGAHAETDSSLFIAPLLAYIGSLAATAIAVEKSRTRADKRNARDLELLTGAIGDIVLHLDRTGAVVTIVGDIHKAYGLDRRDLVGRGFFQRVHVADRPAFLKLVSDAVGSDLTSNAVLRLQVGASPEPSGRYLEPVFVHFDARTCHVGEVGDGATAMAVCILRDVTAAKKAEAEVAAAREESERATAAKTRFLANVSHELRTPLNAIIGFSEMLGNDDLAPTEPEKRKEYAQIISSSGHHLLEVVNSILDMSKIESGSMQLFPEPFSLPALADQCCDMMQLKAEEGEVTLARDYSGHLPEIVADRRACKQILINLLSNAVKFTPRRGQVKMLIRPDGNHLAFSVVDSGIGISPADMARLGDPFFQASASHDRAYEGTGLGLSVVRGLVGLHGGTISVESAPKSGTTVTVRLPVNCREQVSGSMARIEVIPRIAAAAANGGKELEQQAVKKIA